MRAGRHDRAAAARQVPADGGGHATRKRLGHSGFRLRGAALPGPAGLVDEIGTLTWREIDRRCDAFAAALQALPGGRRG